MIQYPANNVYTGYWYNAATLVTTVDNYIGSDQPSYFYYSYSLDGNQTYKSTMDSGYLYSYDRMGRLIEEDYQDGSTFTYTYDQFSNRATMTAEYDLEFTVEYTYDLNNRLVKEIRTNNDTREESTTTYTYDANGNQLTKTTVDGTEMRAYNGLGQLVSVSGNSTPVAYAYRPDGLRYSKTSGGVTHIQLWDGQNIVAEVGVNNVVNTRYLRGVNLIAREIDGALQYYQFDAHGDVLHRIDASGNVLKTYVYDAFGVETDPEPLDTNPFRYCGEYFDRETGTYYLRARNYDPVTGRFTTEDKHWNSQNSTYGDIYVRMNRNTILPNMNAIRQSTNKYPYCLYNPVLFIDPLGLRTYIVNGINNPEETGVPAYIENFKQRLSDKGIKNVKTVSAFNKTNTLSGTWEVVKEMANKGRYASAITDRIKADLVETPLEEGEELNLIGYSGGGQVVLNVSKLLSGTAKVNNIILIGTPVAELSIKNTDRVVTTFSWRDPLSWNVAIGENIVTKNFGNIGHTRYFDEKNIDTTVSFVVDYIN